MHYFLGPKSYETSVYEDREAFFADLVQIYQDEIADLAARAAPICSSTTRRCPAIATTRRATT